ncbi:MAG TPA: Mce protein [Mycobacterium sp.]|uniref:Mce protein n=1 Tax=Mycobacterium sp. TaxID=1785 RepID=UPI002C459EBF|nr:Mce protein [Mycobacterium sp.]HXO82071.1 Mce protein [Mycobacterium sp.]
MAEHDGAAEKAESVAGTEQVDVESTAVDIDAEDIDAEDIDAEEDGAGHTDKRRVPKWVSSIPGPIAVGVAIIVALLGLGGWLGFRVHQDNQVQAQRNLYVQVARQTAINLTTINYTEVDADIKRVLDSATGAFHDEFQNRSQPFVEVVKKVQSKSEGSISEAGLLSYAKDQAQVLVAVAVKTSMAGAPPDQEPRRWRMRLTVDKTGDSAKVSNVEFVP